MLETTPHAWLRSISFLCLLPLTFCLLDMRLDSDFNNGFISHAPPCYKIFRRFFHFSSYFKAARRLKSSFEWRRIIMPRWVSLLQGYKTKISAFDATDALEGGPGVRGDFESRSHWFRQEDDIYFTAILQQQTRDDRWRYRRTPPAGRWLMALYVMALPPTLSQLPHDGFICACSRVRMTKTRCLWGLYLKAIIWQLMRAAEASFIFITGDTGALMPITLPLSLSSKISHDIMPHDG